MLHAALREVLGTHVQQKGSLVAPDRLRFDFSHFQSISAEELALIERKVNEQVRANNAAEVHHMGMQEALDFGAMALFGEKYGENVRVLKMGDYSTELCGGTHVSRTGDIGLFKITSEGGVSAGVRRIEAVTGQGALDLVAAGEARLAEVADLVGGQSAELVEKVRALVARGKQLERELEQLKAKAAVGATADLGSQAVEVAGIKVLAARLEGFDAKALRDAVDRLKQQLGDAVILLAGVADGKASLVAGVAGAALGKAKAGALISHVAAQIGGKGGGRPDMAQGVAKTVLPWCLHWPLCRVGWKASCAEPSNLWHLEVSGRQPLRFAVFLPVGKGARLAGALPAEVVRRYLGDLKHVDPHPPRRRNPDDR